MGRVIELIDTSDFDQKVEKFLSIKEAEEREAEKLSESTSFKMVRLARKYDDWFLDPIVGFLIPGVGDFISSSATLPAIYVAVFKLRSFKLVMAILTTMLIDLLVGFVPFVGDLVDAFYKSSKIANRLIVGYVENDPVTLREIDKRAKWGTVGLIICVLLIWMLYTTIVSLYHWIVNLF